MKGNYNGTVEKEDDNKAIFCVFKTVVKSKMFIPVASKLTN